MDAHLVLVPEEEGKPYGVVKPIRVNGGTITYGLSIGSWKVSDTNGHIHIVLKGDLDTIIHEVATRKGVEAELRAAERYARGEERKRRITLDPRTKRFKEEYL